MSMRAFVALEVPAQVLDSIVGFQGELLKTRADLKLVERENLHFTVKFLGDVRDADAAEAGTRLSRLSLAAATVDVKGAGAFPTLERPRVVWVGTGGAGAESLEELAREVIGALEGIGERDTRPFRAHLTVARVRSGRNSSSLSEFVRQNSDRSFGTAALTAMKLKSSELTPRGPIYTDIGVYPLS